MKFISKCFTKKHQAPAQISTSNIKIEFGKGADVKSAQKGIGKSSESSLVIKDIKRDLV